MDTKMLEVFLSVAEAGSFSKAGEMLFMTSASVMNHMNALENAVGVELFARTSKGVKLTQSGELFVNSARRILEVEAGEIQALRGLERREKKLIRIGASSMFPAKEFYEKWRENDSINSLFELELVPLEGTIGRVFDIEMGLGSKYDIVLASFPSFANGGGYQYFELERRVIELVVPTQHRFAGRNTIELSDLEGESLLIFRKGIFKDFDAAREYLQGKCENVVFIETKPIYDSSIFDYSIRTGLPLLMNSQWAGIHPCLVAKKINWNCSAGFGAVFKENACGYVSDFLKLAQEL